MTQPDQPTPYFRAMPEDLILFVNDNPWLHRFVPMLAESLYTGERDVLVSAGIRQPGATARLQIRLYEGAPGDPLLSISTGDDAASKLTIDTWLFASITSEDLATLPAASQTGEPAVFRYDLLIAIPGIGEQVAFYGKATVRAGVTR